LCLSGEIYYVSQLDVNCNDSGPGNSTVPWCNLTKPCSSGSPIPYRWVPEGSVVIVREGDYGDYSESTISNCINNISLVQRNKWTLYKAAPGEKVVFNDLYLGTNWGYDDQGRHYQIWDGFEITGGINIISTDYITVRNCNVTNNNVMPYEGLYAPYFYANYNVIAVTSSTHITLENNDIWRNHRGIDMGGGGYNIIRNNSVHHVGEDLINPNSDNTIVENNILYDINKRRTPLWVFEGDMIGAFEVNETIMQENTGAEGLVISVISPTRLNVIQTNDRDFDDEENVTGLSSGALLYNVYVDYAHTDSIQIHSESRNLVVKGNRILRPEGGQGLKMVGPGNVTVVNNFIYTTVPLYWSGTERGITFINNTLVLPPGLPSSSGAPAVGYEALESNIMNNMSNNIIYRWAMATDRNDLGNYTVYTRIIDHSSNIFGNDPDDTGGPTYPFYIDYDSEIVNYNIDSLFVDPANMDYRVIMSSPCMRWHIK